MFLASLNLDLFFKKVFSNKRIAKKFLEDFFNVHITEITPLPTENRMTNESSLVKFDYRCKINGSYVVIEMQQKYKTDVNKRFYLYHCVSTALQLETLESVEITKPNGETYKEKDYTRIEPVITLIWMVDDVLGFEEDFIAFTTLPEMAKDFISDREIWQQPIENIRAEREKVLKTIGNTTKKLDFFSQNRIIYAFQKNIVKNKKHSAYFKWFDFAQKSRNFSNEEEDFSEYKHDKTMAELITKLRKDKLTVEEFKYVSDAPHWEFYILRQGQILTEKLTKKLTKKFEKQIAIQKREFEKIEIKKIQAEQDKQKAEQDKQKADAISIKSISILLKIGQTIPEIAEELGISIEEVAQLAERI